MAVDSRARRSNVVGLHPWTATLPPPDGSMDQADRQHLAFVYRGILSAEEAEDIFPDPFAATATPANDPFAATASPAVNPFAATGRYKGS